MAATKKVVDRKDQFSEIGAKLAAKHGVSNVTRRMVAKVAKVSEALVSHHMGDATTAQAAYKRRAKKLGLTLPTAAQEVAMGARLRAHGPRKNPVVRRKRSDAEIQAIRRKEGAAKKSASTAGKPSSKKVGAQSAGSAKPFVQVHDVAPIAVPALAIPEGQVTAARAPKAPPSDPLPLPPVALPLPV